MPDLALLHQAELITAGGVGFLAGLTIGRFIRPRAAETAAPAADLPRLAQYSQGAHQAAPVELWQPKAQLAAESEYDILDDDSVMRPFFDLLANETKFGLAMDRSGLRITSRLCADYGISAAAWKELTERLVEAGKAYRTKGKGGKLVTVLKYSKGQAYLINMRNKRGWIASPPLKRRA